MISRLEDDCSARAVHAAKPGAGAADAQHQGPLHHQDQHQGGQHRPPLPEIAAAQCRARLQEFLASTGAADVEFEFCHFLPGVVWQLKEFSETNTNYVHYTLYLFTSSREIFVSLKVLAYFPNRKPYNMEF